MIKVLFVEERADLRAVIEDAFCEVGYDVAAVAAERDALATAGAFQPDLVIYDRDGLNGESAAEIDRIIRHLTQDREQPLIVLGDRNDPELEAPHRALCLSAPLDVDALIVAAAGLLNGELAAAPVALN